MKKLIITVIVLGNVAMAATQLWLTSIRSSDGQSLAQIQSEMEQLSLDNWRLREQIAEKSSLTYIYSKVQASDLSYTKPQFATSLPVVAVNPSTP
jgi:hypothetical protein